MNARQLIDQLTEADFDTTWKATLARMSQGGDTTRIERLLDLARQADSTGTDPGQRMARNYRHEAEMLLADLGIEVEFRQKGGGGSIYPVFTVGARRLTSPANAISHAALLSPA